MRLKTETADPTLLSRVYETMTGHHQIIKTLFIGWFHHCYLNLIYLQQQSCYISEGRPFHL